MKYVGARNNFIRAPFAIQGIVIAVVAVVLTMTIINFGYPAFIQSMNTLETGFNFISFDGLFQELVVLLVIIGLLIGVIGSSTSMKKYLDV